MLNSSDGNSDNDNNLIKTNILELNIGDEVHYKGNKHKITSIEIPYQHLRIIGLSNRLFVRFATDKAMMKFESKHNCKCDQSPNCLICKKCLDNCSCGL